MERRNFVYLAMGGVVAVATPTLYYKYGNLEYDKSIADPQLLSNIMDSETIAEIGKLYLIKYPDESSERKLVKLLLESTSAENGSIETSITSRIKEDFETGSIVTIDGWILTTTEGRQCALCSLTNLK